jgi:AraC family transcriptional regulator of adaptative response/methylated-DNA-[protein]-cysteine methyltransferase
LGQSPALSGGGRLHDLFVSVEAATPGMVQQRGEGMEISYGYHASPAGELLIGLTGIGVCWIGFTVGGDRDVPYREMQRHWPKARLFENASATRDAADHIMRIWRGQETGPAKLKIDLHGTNFQIQVWRALLKIPSGSVASYGDIAVALGDENASRAVGTAVGYNPVSLLIPCHRVIQKSGIVENYMWGTPRKKMLLGLEVENIAHGVKTSGFSLEP